MAAEGGSEGFEQLNGIGGEIKVWDKEKFEEKFCEAKKGGVFKGKDFIYPLWKTLLNVWFAKENSKIYILSPFVDEERIEDVCRIILKNNAEDQFELLYTRDQDKKKGQPTLGKQKKSISKRILKNVGKKREAIRHRLDGILEKIRDPYRSNPNEYFHAKFIGCVRGTTAEVLITSANFQAYNFGFNNRDTVCYLEMTEEEFIQRFIQPLECY